MIVTFTYNRLHFLIEQAREMQNPLVVDQYKLIIDDGSDYHVNNLVKLSKGIEPVMLQRFKHVGKQGFWQLWDFALSACEDSKDELFIFLQDDLQEIDWQRILDTHERLNSKPYVCQLINDNRGQMWTTEKEKPFDDELTQVDWTDCPMFCNRKAFDWIGYNINHVPEIRFRNPIISSGVGEQLTKRFNFAGIPIYRPIKSFAKHGDHPSVMHPNVRKQQPLISK